MMLIILLGVAGGLLAAALTIVLLVLRGAASAVLGAPEGDPDGRSLGRWLAGIWIACLAVPALLAVVKLIRAAFAEFVPVAREFSWVWIPIAVLVLVGFGVWFVLTRQPAAVRGPVLPEFPPAPPPPEPPATLGWRLPANAPQWDGRDR